MLDDLRNSLMDPYDEEEVHEEEQPRQVRKASKSSSNGGELLGMTAVQRFIIALMVLLMVCVLGAFFLLVTGKIALPI